MSGCRRMVAVAALLAGVTGPVHGAQCIGVTMPDSVTVSDHALVLNGMGARKATFLKVKVYAAGLYLTRTQTDPAAIIGHDQPRHLVLEFVRDVDREDINKAWVEGFEKNAGDQRSALEDRINDLTSHMGDFKQGERLTFSYLPGQGTRVIVNETVKGTIEGADFAAALITIWLGKPPNKEIKTGLLGGSCD